ncbi:hypothetical protein [Streptomyces sp. NBRC 109706]|uniref:hypothetical protein n=1 Tax=Streptomyces sp. NBRC 109706 TaxID=1550035 RepID=UPI000782AEAA|nr:hypothetical protein [Streptomyces sp. NBRC 109706]
MDALLGYMPLPHSTITPTPTEVGVTVATLDDLAEWALALGGTPAISPPWDGVETWALHTTIPVGDDRRRLRARVAALAPVDAPVPPALEGASRMRLGAVPTPIYVDRRPVGAALDITAHMERVLRTLAEAYVDTPDEIGEIFERLLVEPEFGPAREMDGLIDSLDAGEIRLWQPGRMADQLAACASPEERSLMAEARRPIPPAGPGVAA